MVLFDTDHRKCRPSISPPPGIDCAKVTDLVQYDKPLALTGEFLMRVPRCWLRIHVAGGFAADGLFSTRDVPGTSSEVMRRSPEVVIRAGYGTAADIWSTACMTFELATGDYLIQPKDGPNYTIDSDHMAKITKLLGLISPDFYKKGDLWNEFFDEQGELLHTTNLKRRSLMNRLLQKRWNRDDAEQFSSFLTPMLEIDQDNRATAAQMLQHEWLQPREEAAAAAAEDDNEPGPSGLNH